MKWDPPLNTFEQSLLQFENAREVIGALRRNNFEFFLTNELKELGYLIVSNNLKEIPRIVPKNLIAINSRLRVLEKSDKEILELLSAHLFRDLIESIAKQQGGQECIVRSASELEKTCIREGYDYRELEQQLSLNQYVNLRNEKSSKSLAKAPYYEWVIEKYDYEITELARALYEKEIIYGTPGFKKLFTIPKDMFALQANSNNVEELILLFNLLKNRKLIHVRNASHYFSPLTKFAVDREGENIFSEKKGPKRFHEAIKFKIKRGSETCCELDDLILKSCKQSISALDGLSKSKPLKENRICGDLYHNRKSKKHEKD